MHGFRSSHPVHSPSKSVCRWHEIRTAPKKQMIIVVLLTLEFLFPPPQTSAAVGQAELSGGFCEWLDGLEGNFHSQFLI